MTACSLPCGCALGNCLCHRRKTELPGIIHTVTTLHTEYDPGMDQTNVVRSRCVGYFFDIEKARQCIEENWGDIYENGHYNMAVIETVRPGIYAYPRPEVWFTWMKRSQTDQGYKLIAEKPEGLKNVVGFGIG